MAPLLVVLARQPKLQILDLHFNDLTDEQEQQVRSALVYLDCSVFFTYEEYDAYLRCDNKIEESSCCICQ